MISKTNGKFLLSVIGMAAFGWLAACAPPPSTDDAAATTQVEETPVEQEETTTEERDFLQPTEEETPEVAETMEMMLADFDTINFDFNKFNIRNDAVPVLEKQAEFLRDNPDINIVIEGHCDERGTREYNFALGERRANAVRQYLVSQGVAFSRVRTVSFGKGVPLDPGHNEAAWAKNRRATTVVVN